MTGTATPADLATNGATEVRVASVPFSHAYVQHLAPEHGGRVRRIPDPDPDEPTRSTQQRWWPPVMLHPDWIARHPFDVFHVQFGFDAWEPDELRAVVDAVHHRGRPFVYTVHDLRNPHHRDRAMHDSQLDVLVPSADAVLTLTPGAAAEIRRRWNREAIVVPHPHVVPLPTMERMQRRPHRSPQDRFRVGVHIKSLRESMAPGRILPVVERALRALPGGVLQVNGHRDVLEAGGANYHAGLATYLRKAARERRIDLRVHDFFSDIQLWRYLSSLDVSVLPYRFGTHSGWLEACRDLGTTVIAPDCGYYAEQGPVVSYHHHEDDFHEESLWRAVHVAWEHRQLGMVTATERREQRAQIAARHESLYRELLP
jgi:glycosyltransferase involved in cell wall biosynthesis